MEKAKIPISTFPKLLDEFGCHLKLYYYVR